MNITVFSVIDDSILSFKGYEFITDISIEIEDSGDLVNYFRLEYSKENKEYSIYVGNEDDYSIHDDATYLFDLQNIIDMCEQQTRDRVIENVTREYILYCLRVMDEEQ